MGPDVCGAVERAVQEAGARGLSVSKARQCKAAKPSINREAAGKVADRRAKHRMLILLLNSAASSSDGQVY